MSAGGPVTASAWSTAAFEDCGRSVLAALRRYLDESRAASRPVVRLEPVPAILAALDVPAWIRGGGMDARSLGRLIELYLERSTRLHHPHFLAHQVAVPHFAAALADLVNGMLNNGMAVFEMGPSAVALELAVVGWMLDRAGWSGGSGVLTHGGSLANLTALLAARARALPEAWQSGLSAPAALLAPPTAHYSVARAAAILGLGAGSVRSLPTDARGVLLPAAIEPAARAARAEGRTVVAVVASACATATGLYDPLAEVGAACRELGLWLHVDGAHGASALLSARHRARLAGLEAADSLVWDAHKMLGTSALCAAVLFRDPRSAQAAFRQDASYFPERSEADAPDLFDRALECTKTGLGLKLFLVLAFLGEEGLGRHVDELYDRARSLHDCLARRPRFRVPCEPQSNILCFRYGDDDELQERIRARLLADGDFHLSAALVGGRRHLRACVMNPATDERAFEALLDRIEAAAQAVAERPSTPRPAAGS